MHICTFSSPQREAQDLGGPLKLLHEAVEPPSYRQERRSSITQKQGYGEMFNVEMTLVGSWKNKLVPKAPCLILAGRKSS
ncbi:hypothetical protein CapIbe_012704 [Capra ibex]